MANFRKPLAVPLMTLATIVAGYFGLIYPNQVHELNFAEIVDTNGNRVAQTGIDPNILVHKPQGNHTKQADGVVEFTGPEVYPATEYFAIWGRVESEYGEILTGETVTLHSPGHKVYYSVVSNAQGEYSFGNIVPGIDYVVNVSPPGMYNRYTRSKVNLQSAQVTHHIILESISVGVFTGMVVDSYDRPVAGIGLSMRTVEMDFLSIETETDANGAFTVSGFPNGRFEVSASGQQSFRAKGLDFDPGELDIIIETL